MARGPYKRGTTVPKTNHNFAQNNLRYRIIQTLNKFPDNVIRKMYTHIIYGLTSYAKKYFISNYKTECTIEICYIIIMSMLNAVIISDYLRHAIIIFIIKHPYHSGRNVMLDRCLTVLMGEPGRLCVGDRVGLPGLCVFLGNTSDSVVLTWAGTGRVDISVQLLVGFVILLHYKCRP